MRDDALSFEPFEGQFTFDLRHNIGKEMKSRNLNSFTEDFDLWIDKPRIVDSKELDLKV